MKYLIILITIILLIASPVLAQSYYHEITMQLSGDYEIRTELKIPNSSNLIDLEGVGDAFIQSKLIIVEASEDSWWDLF